MIKFYFRTDSSHAPITLYYVDEDDFSSWRFDKPTLEWVRAANDIQYKVISGDIDYEPTTLEEARKFAPEAFKKETK